MNTLQKVTDIENKVTSLEGKLKSFEILVGNAPKLVQDVTSIRTDVAQLTQAIRNVVAGINKKNSDLGQMDNVIMTRLMSFEQTVSSLSKTLAAVVSELSDSKHLNEANVMARLRKSDEAAEKARVEQMLQLKAITVGTEIKADSMAVVAQTFYPKDGTPDLVSEYRAMDMSSPEITDETRKEYIGKTAGDVVELNLDEEGARGVLKTTIISVYDYVQVIAKSDGEPAKEAGPQEEAKQPSAPNQ